MIQKDTAALEFNSHAHLNSLNKIYLDQYFEVITTKLISKMKPIYIENNPHYSNSRNLYKAEMKVSQVVTVYELEDCRD